MSRHFDFRGEKYMLNYNYVNETLLKNKITPYKYKLLFYLLSIADEQLRIPKQLQKDMAVSAGCSRQNVSAGMIKFQEIGLITKDGEGYIFNPELFEE